MIFAQVPAASLGLVLQVYDKEMVLTGSVDQKGLVVVVLVAED